MCIRDSGLHRIGCVAGDHGALRHAAQPGDLPLGELARRGAAGLAHRVDERAAVPHHLIDIIEPTQAYSAAQFVDDAQRLIGEIEARGHLPLLVGGTMLYFKALFDGIDAMPAADPAVRAELDARAAGSALSLIHISEPTRPY